MSLGEGISRMMQCGVWAENELSMEVLSLGKSALQEDDCVMNFVVNGWLIESPCVVVLSVFTLIRWIEARSRFCS
jgi:hypothetical protein